MEEEEATIDLEVDQNKQDQAQFVELPAPDPRYNAASITQICKKKNIVWRDKLNINFQMDSVTLLEQIAKFFNDVRSFEVDPETKVEMTKDE